MSDSPKPSPKGIGASPSEQVEGLSCEAIKRLCVVTLHGGGGCAANGSVEDQELRQRELIYKAPHHFRVNAKVYPTFTGTSLVAGMIASWAVFARQILVEKSESPKDGEAEL